MRFKNQNQPENRAEYPSNMPYDNMPVTCGSFNQMPTMPVAQMPMAQMPMAQPGFQMPAMPAINGQQMLPTMPTGFPTGGTTTPLLPSVTGTPAIPVGELPPTTVQSPLYTPGFLRTQIGKKMRVEFLIGTNLLTDRTGTLIGVGASYILLRPIDSDDILMCDIYSIKFVTIIL